MKKIIALCLLLAVSVSFGAVSWTIEVNGSGWDGMSSINLGDVVTVGFMDDAALNGGFTNFVANVSNGAYNAGSLAWTQSPMFASNFSAAAAGTGFNVNITATMGFGVAAGEKFSFAFTADQMGLTTISSSGAYGTGVLPADVTMNVVPEPMTMALLGLGGLFIRRRRA